MLNGCGPDMTSIVYLMLLSPFAWPCSTPSQLTLVRGRMVDLSLTHGKFSELIFWNA